MILTFNCDLFANDHEANIIRLLLLVKSMVNGFIDLYFLYILRVLFENVLDYTMEYLSRYFAFCHEIQFYIYHYIHSMILIVSNFLVLNHN